MRSKVLIAALAGASVSLMIGSASAATVGLWLFDDLVDQTPPAGDPPVDPVGGETLYDSSGNNRHFVATDQYGAIGLTSDRPAIMAASTYALDSNGGGGHLLSTPSTPAFHIGNTGQLTVEFWYKHVGSASFPSVLSFNGGNPGSNPGDWELYISTPAGELHADVFNSGGGLHDKSFGATPLDGNWHHIAASFVANDALRVYIDGVAVGSPLAIGAIPAAAADVLKFARDKNDGQGSVHFLMDELRISDVALLPGNGDGNGVLAWNTSLAVVPEPTTVAFAAMAGLGVLSRRRR